MKLKNHNFLIQQNFVDVGYHYVINVDGGINADTINLVKEAGADMVVSGSYVCKSEDYNERIESLR